MHSGIVFDFDGVLYDSEKHWLEVENDYLLARVPAWDVRDYKNIVGCSLSEAYDYLKLKGLNVGRDEYFADYNTMALELYSNKAKPLKNVALLLRELTMNKAKMAIASSSKRSWIEAALQSSELPAKIEVIVTVDDESVINGKPSPDVYLRAAKLLNENPADLLAIEDSSNGIDSAKSAGFYCLGLRNGFNGDQSLDRADDVIYGFDRESIEKIMRLIG
ncbi:MAG TPA: HAD family phosphatase [Candidatus Saccharimonadales bacterium]|nr:HAD family phosphatase [Candidatus Saccharimonadales bacterium]